MVMKEKRHKMGEECYMASLLQCDSVLWMHECHIDVTAPLYASGG